MALDGAMARRPNRAGMNGRAVVAVAISAMPRGLAGLCLILAAASPARAQDAAAPPLPDGPGQVVEIKQPKNPAMMPYRKAYDLLSKVDEAGAHRLRAVFRVTSPTSHQAVPDLRIAIEGENTHLSVPVSASGLVDLPVDPAALADDADIVANKPKAALAVDFFVVPEIPAGKLTYGQFADSVSAAQSALARIVPWYARLLMSSVKGVGLCYPDDAHAVSIEEAPETARAAREPDLDAAGNKVFCARFSASEALEHKDRVVVPEAGWVAIFW
jgi:hypothetical protein